MRILLVITLLLIARLSLASADDTVTSPTRIISCAPNLTEMLFALGAGDSVIGVTRYCQYPPEARALPKYGDLYNPSLEAMVAAQPDTIVLLPGNQKVMDYFRERENVCLVQTINPESIAEIEQTIMELGTAIGREERARALVQSMRDGFRKVAAKHALVEKPTVLIVIGRERGTLANLYAAGANTYFSELLEIAGAENAVQDADLGRYPVLNRETLLRMNPDIIIETHHDAADSETTAEMKAAWRALTMIRAVRNARLLVLEDKHLLVPGPHLDRDARYLAELIHGHE